MEAKAKIQAQQCAQHPELLIAHIDDSAFQQLIFVGDIHGDFGLWRVLVCWVAQVATLDPPDANVMDRRANLVWTAQNTCLVLLGDMMDGMKFPEARGILGEQVQDEALILYELNHLALQALLVGGRVVKCMGNHERLNQLGRFDGASQIARRDPLRTRISSFSGDGMYSTLLQSCGIFAVVKIGPFLVMHGGIAPQIVKEILKQPHKVHQGDLLALSKQMLDLVFHPNLVQPGQERKAQKLIKQLFDSPDSLLWSRHYSGQSPPPCSMLSQVLRQVNEALLPKGQANPAQILIVGHTIQSHIVNAPGLWHHETLFPLHQEQEEEKEERGKSHLRRVLGGPATESGQFPRGIRMACPDKKENFTLYMIDVGQSRAIDPPSLAGQQIPDSRLPSVLRFIRRNGKWEPQTLVAQSHLPRA